MNISHHRFTGLHSKGERGGPAGSGVSAFGLSGVIRRLRFRQMIERNTPATGFA
jgi:hypothetical protein